jgi:predicted DNA-binding transcriptional regulator AlpA
VSRDAAASLKNAARGLVGLQNAIVQACSQDDRLIDFKETAHLLGDTSERSVRRLIASGELPQPVKVLSAPRLDHSEEGVFGAFEKQASPRQR